MAKELAVAVGKCLIHFQDEGQGALTQFTEKSLKFFTCHEISLTLDGEQQEIATKSTYMLKSIQNTKELSLMIQDLYHHRRCYANLTKRHLHEACSSKMFEKRK